MKLKERLRKCCPKCNKLSIYRAKSTKKYRCWSCKTVFEIPKTRAVQHREIALRSDRKESLPAAWETAAYLKLP
jgi:ribosomal protein L37AE/L43A